MKMTIQAIIAITAAVAPAFAQENIIFRRVSGCMRQVADFLQRHQCMALKSGDRVKIEREDASGLYCVRIPERSACYWVRRNAFKR